MRSIGALSLAAEGASYYERDGYYAKDDPEHRAASAWHGRGGRRARPDLDALGMGAAELARRVEEAVNRISEIVISCRAWGGGLLWDDGDRPRGADARPSSTRQRLQESFARVGVGG